MTINDEEFGVGYSITCDCCGDRTDYYDEAEDFYDCLRLAKEDGWKAIQVRGEWENHCPECSAMGKPNHLA